MRTINSKCVLKDPNILMLVNTSKNRRQLSSSLIDLQARPDIFVGLVSQGIIVVWPSLLLVSRRVRACILVGISNKHTVFDSNVHYRSVNHQNKCGCYVENDEENNTNKCLHNCDEHLPSEK